MKNVLEEFGYQNNIIILYLWLFIIFMKFVCMTIAMPWLWLPVVYDHQAYIITWLAMWKFHTTMAMVKEHCNGLHITSA